MKLLGICMHSFLIVKEDLYECCFITYYYFASIWKRFVNEPSKTKSYLSLTLTHLVARRRATTRSFHSSNLTCFECPSLPLKSVNVISFRSSSPAMIMCGLPKGLISGYFALNGDNSVASCGLREAILLFGLTAILCLFACLFCLNKRKNKRTKLKLAFC